MSFLSIKDAPLKTTIVGDEKIPTGGYGDLAISVQQIKDFTALSFSNVDNTADLDKPVSNATQVALDLKANVTYVDTSLSSKADKTYVDDQLALKASKIYVDTELQKTASKTYVDNQLATKASTTYVDSINSQKANLSYVDSELALKSDITYVDEQLTLKAGKATTLSGYGITDAYTKDQVDASVTAVAGGHKAYTTLALAQAAQASLPANTIVEVTNDPTASNNGTYQWNGTTLTKSAYDPLTQAKDFTYSAFTSIDYTAFTQGTYIRPAGTEAANTGFACTGYIPVVAGLQYSIYTNLLSTAPIVWFNSSKQVISSEYASQTTLSEVTYTAPANAAFVRVNLNGTASTAKPYIKAKIYSIDKLNKWFEQYQAQTIAANLSSAITPVASTVELNQNKITDSLILNGTAPYWVRRAKDGTAAILDFDFDNNRFFYRGTVYPTQADAIAKIGGRSAILDATTKAFALYGSVKEGAKNLTVSADASDANLNLAQWVTTDTTVTKVNNAIAISRNPSTTGVSAILPFQVKANQTYIVKSINLAGGQGLGISVLNSTGGVVLGRGAWQSTTEEIREFKAGAADETYSLKIELPGNGATSYMSYCRIFESVAFAGLNKDGFTLVADFTPTTSTGTNETFLDIGETTNSRANYVNYLAVMRSANGNGYYTASNMLNKSNAQVAYAQSLGLGSNIAQNDEKSTAAVSIGGGFVSASSGYGTVVSDVDHTLLDFMSSAMITVGAAGTNAAEKVTGTLNRFSIFSKSFRNLSENVNFFTSQKSKLLVLGDSFATKAFADALQAVTGKKTLVDGAGGSTLIQQAYRFEKEPKLWDCTLVIMDGGFEFKEKYAQGYIPALQRIIACIESAGHSRYVYVQPSPTGYADYAIGTARRASWDEGQAEIAKLVGVDRYIPTLTQMQAFGDGSTTDNNLIAQGLMPASLRIDDIHENTKGTEHRTAIIKAWFDSHPSLLP